MTMRRLTPSGCALLPALMLAGCSMAPRYEQPALPVPPSWPGGDAYLQQSEATLPRLVFAEVFADPRLKTLLDQALVNNRDLRVAAANVVAARAQYRVQRASLFPQIAATTTVTQREGGSTTGSTAAQTSYAANLGASAYELDLFGRLRSLSDAALDRYFAQEATARATRLSLVGEIATAWATYAADKSLLVVAQETAASARQSVDLTRARLRGGIAPRTDLRQAEQILETANASIAAQTTAIAQDLNALQLLVGAPIEPAMLPGGIEEIAPRFHAPGAGLESAILLRRPDVVQAEFQLRAANAEIGAARAALFPRITLTGLLGFTSNALSALFDNGSFNHSISGSGSYAIFAGGSARAGVTASQAQRDAALATYEKAIQSAFRDVADALARRGTLADQLAANEKSVAASDDNYRLTDARYRGGIDTFLTSLDAQRTLFTARRTLIATQLADASNVATLYTALGGDSFAAVESPAPQP